MGLFLIFKRRRWRESALPITWLGTALTIHLVHRPWWPYYYLHLAIPLAWLAGLAVGEAFGFIAHSLNKVGFSLTAPKAWKAILICALTALPLARSLSRLEATIKDLRQRPGVEASAIISGMKQHAATTQWVYCDNPIYAFHAKLPMPPELAVVTLKRFWSGQITTTKIVEICQLRHVEQLLLGSISRQSPNWTNLLSSNYVLSSELENLRLYRATENGVK